MKMKKNRSVRVFFDDKTYEELEKVTKDLGLTKIAETLRLASTLGLFEVRETGESRSYLRLSKKTCEIA